MNAMKYLYTAKYQYLRLYPSHRSSETDMRGKPIPHTMAITCFLGRVGAVEQLAMTFNAPDTFKHRALAAYLVIDYISLFGVAGTNDGESGGKEGRKLGLCWARTGVAKVGSSTNLGAETV